jgi:UrcA family protein
MTRAILIALAAASLAAPAMAESTKVNYSDLNLQSHAGAKTMLVRVTVAVRKVCGPSPVPADLTGAYYYRKCLTATMSNALTDLNAPLVTAALGGLGATSRTVAAVGETR